MKRAIIHILILAVTLILVNSTKAVAEEKMSVTIPLKTENKEVRVISFKATVTYGWVISFPKTPKGWSICLTNDPVWKTTVDGHASIGSGAEYSDFFNNFLVIEKIEPERIPFDIQIEIVTTTDFEKEEHAVFTMKDLKLSKWKD
jgi:hypothetical protein